jgi:hypothetical protein
MMRDARYRSRHRGGGVSIGRSTRPAPLALCVMLGGVVAGQTPPVGSAPPEIHTDRPDITESSVVIPADNLQIENGQRGPRITALRRWTSRRLSFGLAS